MQLKHYLGLMKIHPRKRIVDEAHNEILGHFHKTAQRYDLTLAEMLNILSNLMTTTTWGILRLERHPEDPGKKADEA